MYFLSEHIREEIRGIIQEELNANRNLVTVEEPKDLPLEIVNQKILCERLDLSEPTVIRWRNAGKIPFMQIGSAIRYDLALVMKALGKNGDKHSKKNQY